MTAFTFVTARTGLPALSRGTRAGQRGTEPTHWDALAETAILVLGSPRSGTTWLAKIFDSHPDTMYRHEPDELQPPLNGAPPAAQLAAWIAERRLRSAAKRPFFKKSWRSPEAAAVWRAFAAALAIGERSRVIAPVTGRVGLPDLISRQHRATMRAVVKLVAWDGSLVARAMPSTRCVFILRNPCGQIASVIAGMKGKTLSPSDAQTAVSVEGREWAARHGVNSAAFDALPEAGRFAWAWRAFNEPAVEAMSKLPNAKIVIYEDLCRDPMAVSGDLFAFAGLSWDPQTSEFLDQSTRHEKPAGYFDVFRTTELVADRWRQTMSQFDQEAVEAVVRSGSLSGCWTTLRPA